MSTSVCGGACVQFTVPDVEDLLSKRPEGKKWISFCRCWKSKTFPFCDGAHAAHNKATGDNLFPVQIALP